MQHSTTPDTHALAESLAHRCEEPQPEKNGWVARCPAHQDTTPSLSITPRNDKVLLKCFAGCTAQAIVEALGLTMADLFLQPTRRTNGHKRLAKIYDYHDTNGNVVHQTVRYDPKGFTQRRPDPANPGKHIWDLKGIEPMLYRLPDLHAALQAGQTIYLPAGEKDVEALRTLGLTATCNAMGAGKWRQSYSEGLRGGHCVILPDNDAPGREHAQQVARSLDGKAAGVKVLALPGLPAKGDVSDWLKAGGTRTALEAMAAAAPVWSPAETPPQHAREQPPDAAPPPGYDQPPEEEDTGKPVIRITTDMPRVVNATQQAIVDLPGAPHLFQRARQLVIMARGIAPPKWLQRPKDTPVIVPASPARLRELACEGADWQKYDKRGKRWEPALPPPWVIETLCARPSWPFLPLEGIVCAPTLRPDGSILDIPGYDVSTGLYYDHNGTQFPPIPDTPSQADAQQARDALAEVFQDFPFRESHDRAATLASQLTAIARSAIQGNVPLVAVDSTTPGSGKGLLVDAIALTATGRLAARWAPVLDEDEERKRLITLALAGDPLILIDNVTAPLGSAALDGALTAGSIADRLLGTQERIEAPMTACFFATGNGLTFKGDLARRVVPICLAPQVERPEERDDFAHPDLLAWVRQERPRLVVAALTLLRAYVVAGRPAQDVKPIGSYTAWSDLIRAALIWVGEPDPALGRATLTAERDEGFDAFRSLLACWHACYEARAATIVQAIQDMSLVPPPDANNPRNRWHDLHDALSMFDPTYRGHQLNAKAIGNAIRKWAGRIVDGKRLVRSSTRKETGYAWRVESALGAHTSSSMARPPVSPVSPVSLFTHTRENGREMEVGSVPFTGIQGENDTFDTGDTATPTREVFEV